MQEIFYNGKINTNNASNDIGKAMLVNDGSFVLVGENDEVLGFKNNETKILNLKDQYVYPAGFDMLANVFKKIDDKIKNANLVKKFQNINEINEEYDNFANYEIYKKEYLKLEKEYIKNGITTIVDIDVDKKEFAFWKKISEENKLSIDIVCYVDLITSKDIMDNNCVTYRKYRNHLRLGGYYLKIDGKVQELNAWLKKKYSGTEAHFGISEFYGEQLYCLIKSALDEKKQIIFEVNGDRAVEEVLTVFNEIEKKDNVLNFYKPIFYGSRIISKNVLCKLKKYNVTLLFEIMGLNEEKLIKKFIGIFRKKQHLNYKQLIDNDIRFLIVNSNFEIHNFISLLNIDKNKKRKLYQKMQKNNDFTLKITNIIKNLFYYYPAFVCFDEETKMSLETQKQANFILSNNSILDFNEDFKINSVYISGEKKY